ncbi:MAG: DUF3209 family protein [Thermus sp.]|uniref:DUF3209 family protein n=2 Tax=Thermus sp. TaxID=275 RepID=UPI0025E26D0A|nr:DUF3209 family protein [Thermus sp.]MCS6867962.1 DUF3209 family protein [Thermus sp.]MCS7219314.1 DUF3209 family protein [Thermus sp.]MDW8018324.1 DUF3209 family protein [Thermus sp.]MDW8358510.1 DUF3209 family protein [Thermus sp.]
MACHELSALRVAIGELLEKEAHDLAHEREELAPALEARPELKALLEERTLPGMRRRLEAALAHLEAQDPGDDPYHRGLILATESALLRLKGLEGELERFFQDLDLLHERLHRLFPRRRG